jgi:hypothetical protein
MALEVLYISRQRNNQALEESPPSLITLASWKCRKQTSLPALPLYIPKLTTNLTPKRSCNHYALLPRKLEIFLFQQAPPLDTIAFDDLSRLDVGG